MIARVRTLTGGQLLDEYVARFGTSEEMRRLAARKTKGPPMEALSWVEAL